MIKSHSQRLREAWFKTRETIRKIQSSSPFPYQTMKHVIPGLPIFFKWSVPVFHYLLFLKFEYIFHEYPMQHNLKLGHTNNHFKWVKVPGTHPYWKACCTSYHACHNVYKNTTISIKLKKSKQWWLVFTRTWTTALVHCQIQNTNCVIKKEDQRNLI